MRIPVFAALSFSALLPIYAQVSVMPYSGTLVSETVQTLADGTHITRPGSKTLLYRDSQGRTRNEMHPPILNPNSPVAPPVMINILDPVAGFRYTLDTNRKIARRMKLPTRPTSARPATPVGGGVAAGSAGSSGQITLATGANSQVSTTVGIPGTVSGGAPANRPRPKIEPLGTQVIEGLLCDGQRSTGTIPAGTMGNDRDIVWVTETWMSQELHIQVLNKSSDPRSGESTTKLTEISRAEPDPALFMVPPDYTIEDQPVPGAQK